jgi:hypothetical protein
MRHPFLGRVAAVLMAVAAALSLGVSAASARTHPAPSATGAVARPSAVQPDYSCPKTGTICFYSSNSWTGSHQAYATLTNHGRCESATVGGVHAGSVTDNSHSIFWVYDNSTHQDHCFGNGKHVLAGAFGYWYLEYNIHSCPQSAPTWC